LPALYWHSSALLTLLIRFIANADAPWFAIAFDQLEFHRLKPASPKPVPLLQPDLRDYRHARAQTVQALLTWLEANANRQSLNDLYVISRCVFWRQQTGD
jgi:hypothetical protein